MHPVVQALCSWANRWRLAAAASLVGLVVLGGTVPAATQAVAETLPSNMARVADLLEEGRSEDALLLLERLVETHPRYGPARLELGRLALERGSGQEALEHLGMAVRLPIRRAFLAWHLLGRTQLMVGRTAEAAHSFDEAISRADRFGPALVGRAGAAFLLGKLAVAEADARRAVALAETPGLAEALLAAILADLGREPEAAAVLSEFEDPWRTLESFRRLLEWLPQESRIEALAARWALGVGAFGEAECFAERALRTLAGFEPLGAQARLYEVLARAQFAGGRSKEALASARRAIERGDDRPQALVLLGRAAIGNMEIEEAVEAYRRALKLDAVVVDEISTTGLAALAEKLGGQAGVPVEDHLEAHADCRSALYLLGQMSRGRGELEAAVGYFQRLAELDGDSGTHYALAGLYRRLGNDLRSRAELELFAERKREEEAEWLRQNEAFRRRLEAQGHAPSQPLEALRIYRALAAEDLATTDDYVAAGRILVELELYEDAREWFEEVRAREPFRRDALEGLARALEGEFEIEATRDVRARLDLLSWACSLADP